MGSARGRRDLHTIKKYGRPFDIIKTKDIARGTRNGMFITLVSVWRTDFISLFSKASRTEAARRKLPFLNAYQNRPFSA